MLDSIVQWSDMWQLKLSNHKCGSLLLKIKAGFDDVNNLLVGDEPFNVLDTVRDLGILVDSKLTFSSHKAKQRIYLIFKSFESRGIALLIFAYKTYILPILDFRSSVWSSHKLADIDRLEDVQRYF